MIYALILTFGSGLWNGSDCYGGYWYNNITQEGVVDLECPTVVFNPEPLGYVPPVGLVKVTVNGEPYEHCFLQSIQATAITTLRLECAGVPL